MKERREGERKREQGEAPYTRKSLSLLPTDIQVSQGEAGKELMRTPAGD